MKYTKPFFAAINEADFSEAENLLSQHYNEIDLHTKNADDSIYHISVIMLIKSIKFIFREFTARSYPSDQLIKPKIDTKNLQTVFFSFLEKLLTLNVSTNVVNSDGQFPTDLFNYEVIPYYMEGLIDIRRRMTQLIEQYEQRLLPGRKVVLTIDLFRSSKNPFKRAEIPNSWPQLDEEDHLSLTLHERLKLAEQFIFRAHNPYGAINLAVANLGAVVSTRPTNKTQPYKRSFVTCPIYSPKYLVLRSLNGTHSESGLVYFLHKRSTQQSIATDMKNIISLQINSETEGCKIYLLILDIVSTREVCTDCEESLYNLQTDISSNGFLLQFSSILEEMGFLLPKQKINHPRLALIVRASGLGNPGWNGNPTHNRAMALFHHSYPNDVKKFSPGVMLHLPPKVSFDEDEEFGAHTEFKSSVLDCDSNKQLKKAYNKSHRDNSRHIPVVSLNKRYPAALFFSNTAFVNSGGNAEVLKRDHSDTVIKKLNLGNLDEQEILRASQLGR